MPDEPEQPIAIKLFLTGAEEVPIVFANVGIVQHQQNEFVLTFAQYSPPLALGSPDDQREQVRAMPFLPVKVVARIGMAADRMAELIGVMQGNFDNWKKTQGGK